MNPQTAILDTTTRVIKRLTTDVSPSFNPTTEISVALVSPIVLTVISVLQPDNVTVIPATAGQIQQAGLDDVYNAQQKQLKVNALKNAITNLNNDATVPTTVKTAFQGIIQVFLS